MDEIVVRCRPKQFEVVVIEVGLNILNWMPISDELLVVLKRVVATSGEDHDPGHISSIIAPDSQIVDRYCPQSDAIPSPSADSTEKWI